MLHVYSLYDRNNGCKIFFLDPGLPRPRAHGECPEVVRSAHRALRRLAARNRLVLEAMSAPPSDHSFGLIALLASQAGGPGPYFCRGIGFGRGVGDQPDPHPPDWDRGGPSSVEGGRGFVRGAGGPLGAGARGPRPRGQAARAPVVHRHGVRGAGAV